MSWCGGGEISITPGVAWRSLAIISVTLKPGKLAAFAGLGALRDLDLHLAALVQIFRRHAEAARRHLLDRGIGVVAVRLGLEARRVFAALAGIRFGADAVHGDVEHFVRLGRQRAQAHARRHEALADFGDGLHFFQRHRRRPAREVHQMAQRHRRQRPHAFGIAPVRWCRRRSSPRVCSRWIRLRGVAVRLAAVRDSGRTRRWASATTSSSKARRVQARDLVRRCR